MVQWFAQAIQASTGLERRERETLRLHERRPFERFRVLFQPWDESASIAKTLARVECPEVKAAWDRYCEHLRNGMARHGPVLGSQRGGDDTMDAYLKEIQWKYVYRNPLWRTVCGRAPRYFPLLESLPRGELLPHYLPRLRSPPPTADSGDAPHHHHRVLSQALLRKIVYVRRELEERVKLAVEAERKGAAWRPWTTVQLDASPPETKQVWPRHRFEHELMKGVATILRAVRNIVEAEDEPEDVKLQTEEYLEKVKQGLERKSRALPASEEVLRAWLVARHRTVLLSWALEQVHQHEHWPRPFDAQIQEWARELEQELSAAETATQLHEKGMHSHRQQHMALAITRDAWMWVQLLWQQRIAALVSTPGAGWRDRASKALQDAGTQYRGVRHDHCDAVVLAETNVLKQAHAEVAQQRVRLEDRLRSITQELHRIANTKSTSYSRQAQAHMQRLPGQQVCRWLATHVTKRKVFTAERHRELRQLVEPYWDMYVTSLEQDSVVGTQPRWNNILRTTGYWMNDEPRTWTQYTSEWPHILCFIAWAKQLRRKKQ